MDFSFLQVLVPVHNDSHWSLYSWDFSTNTISIPDLVSKSMDILCGKHDSIVTRLHKAMLSCKQQFIGCCETHNKKRNQNYLTAKDDSPCL